MPATSGSPTQIATSQPTKTALSNTPADQFQPGDLGYAQDEFLAGNCPLYGLVLTGGPAVNGTTVLSVYQNAAARWVSLSLLVASSTLVVPNIAALQALDSAGYDSGQLVNVQTLRSAGYFVLDKNSTATPDNITIVDALNATGNWLRQENAALSWTYQTTWYVDPAAGNDEGIGDVPGAALRTVAELSRRLTCVFQNSAYTVNVLGDIPATDSFTDRRRIFGGGATSASAYGSVITFQGQLVVQQAITLAAGSTQTLPTRAATDAQAEAVRGAGVWVANDVGQLIVDGGGNTAFVLTQEGGADTARVTDWIASNDTYAAAPVEGAASVNTLTKWRAPTVVGGGFAPQPTTAYAIAFRYLDFDDVGNNVRPFVNQGAVVFFSRCRISNANGGTALRFFTAGSTGFAQITGCLVHNTSPIALAQFVLGHANAPGLSLFWTFGNGFRSAIVTLSSSPNNLLGACVQNGYIENSTATQFYSGPVHNLASTNTGAWIGIYNDFNTFATPILACVIANAGSRLRVEGSVYGTQVGTASVGGVGGLASQNGGVMWLPRNMDAAVTPTKCFNLVPTGAGTEFYLDALASTTGSITAADAGLVLPISIVCTTFAQYIGAVPNGWARNMRNPANNGGFYSGL